MITHNSNDLGKILKQRRLMTPLSLQKLSAASGVSPSHLDRIEKGQRFPSASILRKIANPLGFADSELLTIAGLLSSQPSSTVESSSGGRLDLYVAAVLSQEPPEVQRTVLTITSILKSMAKSIAQSNSRVA